MKEMAQKKILKKKIKIHWGSILILIITLTCLFFLTKFILEVPTKNIYIKNNDILTDNKIMIDTNLINYPSYYTLSKSKIAKIIKKNPLVKKVKIKKRIYPTIIIEIEEYKPLFKNNETGKIVLENKSEVDLDEISVPRLNNHIPSDKYTSFVNGMMKIDKDIRKLVSDIIYEPNDEDKDRFRLLMSDGNTVYITLTKFKQINYYDEVIVKLGGKKGILYLDSGNHFEIIE